MKYAIDKIREEALSLSISERASLTHDLILSLEKQDNLYLGVEYENEIKRRVTMVKEGKVKGESSDDVFNEVEKRYKK